MRWPRREPSPDRRGHPADVTNVGNRGTFATLVGLSTHEVTDVSALPTSVTLSAPLRHASVSPAAERAFA